MGSLLQRILIILKTAHLALREDEDTIKAVRNPALELLGTVFFGFLLLISVFL
ncbi:MAG: hypothetical protein ACN4GW_02560 [Desulforhopalus sp.]